MVPTVKKFTCSIFLVKSPPRKSVLKYDKPVRTGHSRWDYQTDKMDVVLSRGKKAKFLVHEDTIQCYLSRNEKGVVLGPVETNELINCIHTIIVDAESSWKNKIDDYHHHLGYGTYATLAKFGGQIYCDIRRWWRPPLSDTPVPTKTGLVLAIEDIAALIGLQREIQRLFTSPIDPCECRLNGPCRRCRPFNQQ